MTFNLFIKEYNWLLRLIVCFVFGLFVTDYIFDYDTIQGIIVLVSFLIYGLLKEIEVD